MLTLAVHARVPVADAAHDDLRLPDLPPRRARTHSPTWGSERSSSVPAGRMSPCCSPTSPPPPRPCRGHHPADREGRGRGRRPAGGRPGRGAGRGGLPLRRAAAAADRVSAGPRCATSRRPPSEPTLGVSEVDAVLERRRRAGRRGVPGRAGTPGGRPVRPGDRAGAAAAARPAHRRAAPGRPRGRDARRRSPRPPAVPLADVRRAAMLRGAVGPVAEAALTGGAEALGGVPAAGGPPGAADAGVHRHRRRRRAWAGWARPRWSGSSTASGCRCTGPAATCRVFTRSLDDITDRVPEVVEAALALPVRDVVLDGEAIALRPDGRPRPFQETGSRVSSRVDVTAARADGAPVDVRLRRPARRRRGPARPAGRASGPRCSRPRSPSRCGCRGW